MKLLVIQEQHFMKLPNGEIWVDKQSDVKFWDRYLSVFDEIVVCARMRECESVGKKALRSDRDRVSFVGMPDFRGTGGIVKNYAAIQRALKTALAQTDCVIFRAPSPISMVSYNIVKRSKKPFAVELMNNPMTHFSSQSMKSFYQPLIQKKITNQTKKMCLKANGVAYVTEHVLQELYPSTARIKGESNRYFESYYSTINLSAESFVNKQWSDDLPDPIVFIHSGEMMDYRKGQNVFIETLANLKSKGFSVKGILIGDGDKRQEFEELAAKLDIRDEIEFTGWKSGFALVQKELLRGHIFVFPSTGEGLPRSLIEAMASGMLCFGSDIDGICELLPEKLLVKELSAEAFTDKIVPLLENWSEISALKEQLFEKSKEYENSKLNIRRRAFYSKLKKCTELYNRR